jgi:hypothetical protein
MVTGMSPVSRQTSLDAHCLRKLDSSSLSFKTDSPELLALMLSCQARLVDMALPRTRGSPIFAT